MSETPSKNDPSADWPEDVKQAYEHLKLPSLYDAFLANEKMSLEIRRQDRDLKTLAEGIQSLSTQFSSLLKIVEEEWEIYESEEGSLQPPQNRVEESLPTELGQFAEEFIQENQIYLEDQAQIMLMETHDELRELSHMAKQTIHQLLALLPKKEGLIPHLPTWHPIVEEMLQNLSKQIEKSHYQLLARLEDIQIEMINPQSGEDFNASFHHALDYLSGGKPGTIGHVVRVGYKQDQDVLRLAEVTLYR